MTRHSPTRAADIVAVIEDFQAEYGYAPSVREIAERVGLASTSAVHHWLVKLDKAGAIERSPRHARGSVSRRETQPLTADRIEMAYCLSVHGSKPPRVRPCNKHRLIALWWAETVLPKAARLP